MNDDSKRIRNRFRTQEVDPHRVQSQHSTYIGDFRRKENGMGDISEIFHENTKYTAVGEKFDRSVGRFSNEINEQLDEHITQTASRNNLETIDLPEPTEVERSITETVRNRRSIRKYSGGEVGFSEFSTILKYGCGTLRPSTFYNTDKDVYRGYPSAGGFYPVEPYLIVVNVSGLSDGIYYYSANSHELKVLQKMDRAQLLEEVRPGLILPPGTELEDIAFLFVLTAVFWKIKMKYGPRGYRFALLEAGHLAQNVQLLSASLGLGSCSLGGTKETELDPIVGANGVDESSVYGFVVGHPASRGEDDG